MNLTGTVPLASTSLGHNDVPCSTSTLGTVGSIMQSTERRPFRRRARPRPRRRPARSLAEDLFHGMLDPGAYIQRFWTAAAWESLAPESRPANATYIEILDGYQAMQCGIPWSETSAVR